jgi:hypothetical protein
MFSPEEEGLLFKDKGSWIQVKPKEFVFSEKQKREQMNKARQQPFNP